MARGGSGWTEARKSAYILLRYAWIFNSYAMATRGWRFSGFMKTVDAFEMGLRSARPGLLFDTMEMVAAMSVSLGGFDRLESFVRTLAQLQQRGMEDLEWVSRLIGGAYGVRYEVPDSVDAYRMMLTDHVFDIVNRWSYIDDIHTVTRLQAWFYCGFALGRGITVLRGLGYFEDLRNIAGVVAPLDQMPRQLSRLAQEAARQLQTVSEEDDFSAIEGSLHAAAAILDGVALRCAGAPEALTLPAGLSQDIEQFETWIQKRQRDSVLGIIRR